MRAAEGLRTVAVAATVGKPWPSLAGHQSRHWFRSTGGPALNHMKQFELFSEQERPCEVALPPGDIVWGCDYGSGYFHIWKEGRYRRLRPQEFAAMSFAEPGDVVVIENAHMQAKNKSMAQVFTHEELMAIKAIADRRQIQIRLWFHSQTPKWRKILNMGNKSDKIDAETIARIANARGVADMQWFNPRLQYPPRILWAHEQIADMNDMLNIARIDYLATTCPAVATYMATNGAGLGCLNMARRLYPDLRQQQDIVSFFFKEEAFRQGVSLWASLVNYEGEPRAYNGKQPGVKFVINELLRMKPNHFRGGVARSNIMYHGFRNRAMQECKTSKKKLADLSAQKRAKIVAYRQRYRAAMVRALHAMKAYINR